MNQERRPSLGFWATIVVVVAPFFYALLFGPVVWLTSREVLARKPVSAVYRPLVLLCFNGPEGIATPLRWYARLGCPKPDGELVMLGIEARVLRPPPWWQR